MGWFDGKKSMSELKLELKDKKILELVEVMLESNLEIHAGQLINEYLILDRENQVFVWITENSVKFSNHVFTYRVPISGNQAAKYAKVVRQRIQDDIDLIKKEVFKNEIDLIDKLTNLYVQDRQDVS